MLRIYERNIINLRTKETKMQSDSCKYIDLNDTSKRLIIIQSGV